MATEELKTTVYALLAAEQDPDVLATVLALLERRAVPDFADDFTPEQHAAVQEGLRQADAGQTTPAADVFARYGVKFTGTTDK